MSPRQSGDRRERSRIMPSWIRVLAVSRGMPSDFGHGQPAEVGELERLTLDVREELQRGPYLVPPQGLPCQVREASVVHLLVHVVRRGGTSP